MVLVSGRGSNLQALLTTAEAERWEYRTRRQSRRRHQQPCRCRSAQRGASAQRAGSYPWRTSEFGSRAAFDEALARTARPLRAGVDRAGGIHARFDAGVRAALRRTPDQHSPFAVAFVSRAEHASARARRRGARAWRHGALCVRRRRCRSDHCAGGGRRARGRRSQRHWPRACCSRSIACCRRPCATCSKAACDAASGVRCSATLSRASYRCWRHEWRRPSTRNAKAASVPIPTVFNLEDRTTSVVLPGVSSNLGRDQHPDAPSRNGDGAYASTSRITSLVVDSLAAAFAVILKFDGPSDVLLSRFFRLHPSLGQRDRGLIAEAVFFALRRYATLGWMMQPAHPVRARHALRRC